MLNKEEKRIVDMYLYPLIESLEDWYLNNWIGFKELMDKDYNSALNLLSDVRDKAQEMKKYIDLLRFGKMIKHESRAQKTKRESKIRQMLLDAELKGFKEGVEKQKEFDLNG